MGYDSNIHNRHSIRLNGRDYSRKGAYFITICTQNRTCLFGDVNTGLKEARSSMILNEAGLMVEQVYLNLVSSVCGICSDVYVIMPNHFHCVLSISDSEGVLVSDVIKTFKSKTTVEYIKGVKSGIYPYFDKRVWQRNYHEHIIRGSEEYKRISDYISTNPGRWRDDMYYLHQNRPGPG
jgi:REP element-mobilizing transposase RayT